MAKKPPLELRFSAAARAELIGIWHWNASEYGEKRADAYLEFVESRILDLASNPELGIEVSEYPGLRRVHIRKRSRAHGHIVFYCFDGQFLQVIHIYHTAQDWRSQLGR